MVRGGGSSNGCSYKPPYSQGEPQQRLLRYPDPTTCWGTGLEQKYGDVRYKKKFKKKLKMLPLVKKECKKKAIGWVIKGQSRRSHHREQSSNEQ